LFIGRIAVMIIFIDESGDPGFKIGQGSSELFVIALVIFDKESEAEKTANRIKEFKKNLGKSEKYEFKFNKMNKSLRTDFFKVIQSCKFRVRCIVVLKERVYSLELRKNKEKFYNYFLREVLEHNNNTIKNAKLRLDGFGERRIKKALISYLRKELNGGNNKKVMENLKFVDSKKDVLIQLADMITGGIYRYYQAEKVDKSVYKKIIEDKIEDLWEFK